MNLEHHLYSIIKENILSLWNTYSLIKLYLNIFMLRSYFEAFSIRNPIVQSEFNLDTWFANYNEDGTSSLMKMEHYFLMKMEHRRHVYNTNTVLRIFYYEDGTLFFKP
jgi:hypothetical protein